MKYIELSKGEGIISITLGNNNFFFLVQDQTIVLTTFDVIKNCKNIKLTN